MATINFKEITQSAAKELQRLLTGQIADPAREQKMRDNLPLTLELLVAASHEDAAGLFQVSIKLVTKTTEDLVASRAETAAAQAETAAEKQRADYLQSVLTFERDRFQTYREAYTQVKSERDDFERRVQRAAEDLAAFERRHAEEIAELRETLALRDTALGGMRRTRDVMDAAWASGVAWPGPPPPRLTRCNALGGAPPSPTATLPVGEEEGAAAGGGAAGAEAGGEDAFAFLESLAAPLPAPEAEGDGEIVCWGGAGYCPRGCVCGEGYESDGEETPDHYHPEDEI